MFSDTKALSSFAVDDLAKAREFYSDTLGLNVTELDEPTRLLMLSFNDRHETMIYEKPDYTPATYTILNFVVNVVDTTVDELIERGVSFERYEGFDQDEKGVTYGAPYMAWFTDPAGNIIAVMED